MYESFWMECNSCNCNCNLVAGKVSKQIVICVFHWKQRHMQKHVSLGNVLCNCICNPTRKEYAKHFHVCNVIVDDGKEESLPPSNKKTNSATPPHPPLFEKKTFPKLLAYPPPCPLCFKGCRSSSAIFISFLQGDIAVELAGNLQDFVDPQSKGSKLRETLFL